MARTTLRDLMRTRSASTRAGSSIDSEIDQIRQDMSGGFGTAVVKDVISNPVSYLSRTFKDDSGANGDPVTYREALKKNFSGAGVSNPDMVDFAPRNSIIAFPTTSGDASGSHVPEIFFPFFPPHLSFPVKPGEAVWIFYEDMGGGQKRAYWLCRKPSYRQVDDLNFTVSSREKSVADLQNVTEPGSAVLDKDAEDLAKTLLKTFPKYSNLDIEPDDLVSNSIAYREEFVGEPVPRYSKKCGDLVIQGSNNTLISLGIDKSFTPETFESMMGVETAAIEGDSLTSAFDTNQNTSTDNFRLLKPEMAGCIDLVVGRGTLDLKTNSGLNDGSLSLSMLQTIANQSMLSGINFEDALANISNANTVVGNARAKATSLNHFEINKGSDFTGNENESPNEGDFNTLYDSDARFYISMRSTPNAKAGSIINSIIGEDSHVAESLSSFLGEGKSAIVGSAYSIKSYARGNCELQSAMGGSMYMSDGVVIGSSGGAYIHLKPNGDIAIVPGPNGVVKLGGEDADKALLGSNAITGAAALAMAEGDILGLMTAGIGGVGDLMEGQSLNIDAPGGISGEPITSTAGGTVGMAAMVESAAQASGMGSEIPPNGKFASKVLMK